MLITTPLTGTETKAQVQQFLKTCLDFYQGPGTYAAISSWAGIRAAVNAIIAPGAQIDNLESAASFLADLNRLNDLYQTLPAFFAGSLRVWYNFSDLNNLWLDTDRTSPITGAGQAIAGVTDRSGLGYHGAQSTLPSRPNTESVNGGISARFDGVADFMTAANVDYAGSDAVTITVALNKASDAAVGVVAESGLLGTQVGTWQMTAPPTAAAASLEFAARGDLVQVIRRATSATSYAAPFQGVVTGIADISTPEVRLRVSGTQVAQNTSSLGAQASFATYTMGIGARNNGANPFNGSIRNVMILNKVASANELRILREI